MQNYSCSAEESVPLIQIVDEDDRPLLNSSDAGWYKILYHFPWVDYQEVAAQYYDALYHYNIKVTKKCHCEGEEMDYKGIRYETEKFIYQAPSDEDNIPVCLECEYRKECCPHSSTGRTVNISFDLLPHINSDRSTNG